MDTLQSRGVLGQAAILVGISLGISPIIWGWPLIIQSLCLLWKYRQSLGISPIIWNILVVGISPVNSLFNMSFHKLLVENGMPRSWAVIFPNILVRIVPEPIINQQGFWTLLICAFHHANLKWGYERNLRWLERYPHWALFFHKKHPKPDP